MTSQKRDTKLKYFIISPGVTNNPPPRENFQGYDFLKAYEKCNKMRFVCTLALGALTTADLIRLRIESLNRHIYDVVSVLSDVTMHIYTGKV
jgi:hypothetical protein